MQNPASLCRRVHDMHIDMQALSRPSMRATTRKTSQSLSPNSSKPSSYRSFTTSSRRQDDERKTPTQSAQPRTQRPAQQPPSMDLSSLSANQNYRRPDRLQPARPPSPNAKSTAMGIFDKLLAEQKQKYQGGGGTRASTATATPPQFNSDHYGRGGSLSQRTTTSPSSHFNPRSMVPPRSANDINNSVMGNLVGDLNAPKEESLRLTPSLGRQIRVTEVFDLTKTIQLLESRINSRGNDVRKDILRQKYHIRQGQLKKMKRRERWRQLFKEGYIAETARARKMAKQGW